jgi:two-component system CheB/CheR fusion protein
MAIAVLRDGTPEQREAILQTLARQSDQMARLLDDLLEASRVTQDKIELRRTIVDLGAVAKVAADAVRGAMESRGVQLAVEIDPESIWVDGDPARLQQIQVNMLSNAAKYTPAGGHVLLEVRRDGDEAVIRVRDTGAGIPVEMLDKIFDLFVQSEQTLDRSEGGLGLGLTLVRSLVMMHGGSVCARSDGEGKGAEFVVRLPIAAAVGEIVEARAGREPLHRGAKIVLIEDNDDTRDLLCQCLELAGFRAHGAHDGAMGIALARELGADVAIVDVGLPGIDGFEVARRIRADAKIGHIRLIALTGYGQTADRERAFASGFDEHVVKPIAPEKLARLLVEGTPPREP